MAQISLRQVKKAYGSTIAVHPLDLEIGEGELTVFVGPSGCGKSTTLRMIAGLEDVTSGQILIGDRDVTRLEPKDRNIAMVFQNYALYPHKTVFENLAFGLRMRGQSEAHISERVRWAATILGMENLLERRPRQLSGGQMQRVALGRALVRQPQVFLLDEPLSNLDAKLRMRMRDEIARLHRELATNMIYVTHDQVEAMTLGDRIVVMKDGRIQQAGSPLEVYDSPANSFVAGFIGAPEMNLLNGYIKSVHGQLCAVVGELSVPLGNRASGLRPDMQVTLGVRPEHVRLVPANTDGSVPLKVQLIEHLGATSVVIFESDQFSAALGLRALISREDQVELGAVRWVQIDPSRLHLFDPHSGAAIGNSNRKN